MHKTDQYRPQQNLEKPRDPKSPQSTTQDDPCRVLKKNPLKNLRIMLKLNPDAKNMHQNTILHQARNHKIQVNKAAATLAAKSDEKGAEGKKPVVIKKGKKAVDVKKQKQKKPLGKKAAATKKPTAEKKPAEKKPATEEKKSAP
jgi:large subunit ribosomal protein L4e